MNCIRSSTSGGHSSWISQVFEQHGTFSSYDTLRGALKFLIANRQVRPYHDKGADAKLNDRRPVFATSYSNVGNRLVTAISHTIAQDHSRTFKYASSSSRNLLRIIMSNTNHNQRCTLEPATHLLSERMAEQPNSTSMERVVAGGANTLLKMDDVVVETM